MVLFVSSLIFLSHLIPCLSTMASCPHLDASGRHRACDIQPTEIYCGTALGNNVPVKLRIATGGAGQSGLLRALADTFVDDQIRETKCPPFAVAWIKSDTTASFNHLADNSADLSITYNAAAEQIAIAQGIADKRVYAWRDHFLLVGMHLSMQLFYCTGKANTHLGISKVQNVTLRTSLSLQTPPSKRSSLSFSLRPSLLTTLCAFSPVMTSRPPTSKNPPSGRQSGRRPGRIRFLSSIISTRNSRIRHWRRLRSCRSIRS